METLRRYPALRALWISRVVSFLGDSIGLVALIIFMTERTDSSAAVGLLLLAGDFTPSLLAPLLGTIADRSDARRMMVACELGQAVAVGLIVLLQPAVPVVLVLVTARSLLAATFQAVSRSVVGELVEDADLESANAVIGAGTYGLDALGPLVAGALLLGLSARAVLAADVASFLLSAALLLRLPPAAAKATTDHERLFAGAAVGLRAMRAHRLVWIVTLGFYGLAAFTAVDDVALPFLGRDVFHAGDTGISLLYAGSGIGVLVGFALISRRRPSALHLALLGFVVTSAGNAFTGLAPAITIAVVMQGVRGIGNGLIGVGVDTLVQREVPREVRGRVFANVYGGVGVAAGVSYVIGGALVDVVGPRAVLVGAGVGGLACGAIATWASGSRRTRTPPSPTAPSP